MVLLSVACWWSIKPILTTNISCLRASFIMVSCIIPQVVYNSLMQEHFKTKIMKECTKYGQESEEELLGLGTWPPGHVPWPAGHPCWSPGHQGSLGNLQAQLSPRCWLHGHDKWSPGHVTYPSFNLHAKKHKKELNATVGSRIQCIQGSEGHHAKDR